MDLGSAGTEAVQGAGSVESAPCVLCEVDDATHLRTVRDLAFCEPGEFRLVRCRRCGLMYLNPRPTPERMVRYYPDDYAPYRTAIEDESWALMRWARRRNVRRYRVLTEQLSPRVPGRVLDIGCSTGIFLAEMRSAGWEAYGVDTSSTAVAYARQRFGLQVFDGQLSDVNLPEGRFTAATLWDVLEHTFDPLQTLQTIHRLLEFDGIVVVALPHYESLDRLVFGPYWIGYDAPRHLYVFTRQVLHRMLGRAGFEIVWSRCRLGGYFTFVASLRLWINQHVRSLSVRRFVFRLLDIPGIRFLFLPWDAVVDRIGRGSKLAVIARKVEL